MGSAHATRVGLRKESFDAHRKAYRARKAVVHFLLSNSDSPSSDSGLSAGRACHVRRCYAAVDEGTDQPGAVLAVADGLSRRRNWPQEVSCRVRARA